MNRGRKENYMMTKKGKGKREKKKNEEEEPNDRTLRELTSR